MNGEPPESPRLATLQQSLQVGNAAALEAFWQEMARQGTPLIEPIVGDEDHALVTFLWRTKDEVETVAVNFALAGKGSGSEAMTHLPDTDLRHKTYKVRRDTRESYQFSVAGSNVTDPLNPRTHVFPADPENSVSGWVSSVIELPDAPPQPWSAPRPGVPAGEVRLHYLHSDLLGGERRVWVYTPPNYQPDGTPYGLLLLLDGWFYLHLIPAPTILDNLLADGLLPPLVAVMVGSTFDPTRQRDLGCYPPYVDFVTQELLPWARRNYLLTRDPAQTIVAGVSLGGLMAAFTGLQRPGIFGNVLSQSGSFGWRPEDDAEHEWLARQFVAGPLLPLRFYLDVGVYEVEMFSNFGPSLLVTNRHLRDVLRAKGYDVRYTEFGGSHNPMNWQGTLANGLLALLGKDRG